MNSYEERRPGQAVTLQTRAAAEAKTDKETRKRQIMELLSGGWFMTASDIADHLYMYGYTKTSERNAAAPRLTEMVKDGTVEVVGTMKDLSTGRRVSVYKLTGEEVNESCVAFYKYHPAEFKEVKQNGYHADHSKQ